MTAPIRIGILGCGKMARAMAARWLAEGACTRDDLRACTASAAGAQIVRDHLGIECGTSAADALEGADLVLLGIKPQQLADALPGLATLARPGQTWLSLLAGTPTHVLEDGLPQGISVVRCMPNTPARVGQGVLALCPGAHATAAAIDTARRLLTPLGRVVDVAEPQMDTFTAVAGCGPAYVLLFLEALAQAARDVGFAADDAQAVALQVVLGTAELARRDGRNPEVLRAEVTSKGGVTQAAIAVLEGQGWPGTLVQAVKAGVARSAELSQGK